MVDTDTFGHRQLGGVGDVLCGLIAEKLKLKARFDKPGTIQRSSMLCASRVDLDEAFMVGKEAVRRAVGGETGKMITLVRKSTSPYVCSADVTELANIANREKKMPDEFINEEGNDVTDAFVDWLEPLMGGPLPEYYHLKKAPVAKRLPPYA